jgi:hypothetical protein
VIGASDDRAFAAAYALLFHVFAMLHSSFPEGQSNP